MSISINCDREGGAMIRWIVIVISAAVAAGRVWLLMSPETFDVKVIGEATRADFFKDLAHLWVGGLIGGWIALRWAQKTISKIYLPAPTTSWGAQNMDEAEDLLHRRLSRGVHLCGWLALALTIVEVGAFLLNRALNNIVIG
jgi:hypothetical protein